MEFVQFEAESRAVSIGKPCRSLRKHHAAVSGIDVPLERNLHLIFNTEYLPKMIMIYHCTIMDIQLQNACMRLIMGKHLYYLTLKLF